ncbi:MAG: ASKHA domain-containing protein [Desulfatibacillaceae bacterium]|nr:ASKHA domain-containing protein [Desulfatibacillaceae bacterium]
MQRISLARPGIGDNTADAERLCQALMRAFGNRQVRVDWQLLPQLPHMLRQGDFAVKATVFPGREGLVVIDLAPASAPSSPILGLAVDIGTTRVAIRLVDMETGKSFGETSFDNPQIAVGPDILSRIHYAHSQEGAKELARQIRSAIGRESQALAKRAGLDSGRILAAAVAGNTAMTHLFLGLPTANMIREPYIPVINNPGSWKAHTLDLPFAPLARVFVFPNIGSYFGGDLVAGIMQTGMDAQQEVAMLVDVGTNAEVVVGNQDWLMACAGAAGPALEGGMSRIGMMAAPGAIDRVSIDKKTRAIAWHTIEDKPPVGICGSGVIDLAAGLFLAGMMDIRGKLVPDACAGRLIEKDGLPSLVVVEKELSGTGQSLCLDQADLDSLTRSKAAMYTILRTLTLSVGVEMQKLTTFFVAGTFGSYIDPESAVTIGMLPDLDRSVFCSVGNTSLEGAALLLVQAGADERARQIAGRITYLELNVNQEFMNRFSAAKFYPHTDIARFPSVAKKLGAASVA